MLNSETQNIWVSFPLGSCWDAALFAGLVSGWWWRQPGLFSATIFNPAKRGFLAGCRGPICGPGGASRGGDREAGLTRPFAEAALRLLIRTPPARPAGRRAGGFPPRLAVPLSSLWPRRSEQGGDHVSRDPGTRGTSRPGCPGMGADGPPLARPGMAGGRWKQASRIWLELGLTQISKPDRGPSPFPGLGRPCLLTLSAEGASLEGGRPPGRG